MNAQIVTALKYAEQMNNDGFCSPHEALQIAARYYYLDLTELTDLYFKGMVERNEKKTV